MNGSYTRNDFHPSTRHREQIKIIFQYSLMLLAALVAGWILPRFFPETLWQESYQAVIFHFSPTASKITLIQTAYTFAKPILICIAAIFVFAFSSLNCLITDGILVYLGARIGCSLSVLYAMLRSTTTDAPSASDCFLFVLFRLLLVAFFLSFAIRMASYSYRLRIYSREGRTLFEPKTVWALILHTLLGAAICLGLHVLYGYFLYF